MISDMINIQVESRDDDVEIVLSGSLGLAQYSAVKEKLAMLLDGPGCFFYLNLNQVHFTSDRYLDLFLELLNGAKARKAAFILIFDSEELYSYFSRYSNIFEIYENREAYRKSGTRKQLFQIGMHYGIRSGITVSPGVMVSFLLLLLGSIISFFIVLSNQGAELSDKQAQIIALQNQKSRYIQEIDKLEASLGPLRKLGVVQDTTMLSSFGQIGSWVEYLEYLENTRRER